MTNETLSTRKESYVPCVKLIQAVGYRDPDPFEFMAAGAVNFIWCMRQEMVHLRAIS